MPGGIRRVEWFCLAFSLVVAIVLRCAWLNRADIEHFDEGVYAANVYSPETDFKYPFRDLYAPPLFPEMAAWGVTLADDPRGAVWVSLLGGILTIPVVWWTARSWFGPAAGGLVAMLAATSEFHIWLSRSALTDVWLCLWMTAGAYAGWRGLLTGRPLWLFAAGGLAALAWWTKYNGWLTLAIVGGGWLLSAAATWWRPGRSEREGKRGDEAVPVPAALLRGAGIAAAAGALWYPVWKGLAPIGGYAAVAKNHAGYFVGAAGWFGSLVRQVAVQQGVAGGVTFVGALLAGAVTALLLRQATAERAAGEDGAGWRGKASLIGVAWFALCYFGSQAIGAVSVAASMLVLYAREPFLAGLDADQRRARWLAWGFATAWLGGLSLAVPLYRPYPRLALPWLVGTWFAIGAGVPWVMGSLSPAWRRRRDLVGAAILAVSFAFPVVRQMTSGVATNVAWEDRTGLRRAAAQLQQAIASHIREVPPTRLPKIDAVLYVVGEPALFCHLAAAEPRSPLRYAVVANANLDLLRSGKPDPRVPTYILLGERAAKAERGDLERNANGLIRVPVSPFPQSFLVRLDDIPSWEGQALEEDRMNDLECYYLKADR